MTDGIAYYRVSTDRQGESGLGLAAQEKAVSDFAERVNMTIIDRFNEVESGKKNSRPKLKEAIEKCKEQRATLLIAKLDRLSRNAAFLHNLKDELTKAGIEVIAVDMPEALSNTLMLSVMAGMAQHEREMISKRTKSALEALKSKGVKLGRPEGYTHSEATKAKISLSKKIGLVNYDQTAIRYAKDRRQKGATLQEISDDLNNILQAKTPTGKNFTPQIVFKIVRYAD
jgi:DNA invertase Pin-like site-specific DNA recombinase